MTRGLIASLILPLALLLLVACESETRTVVAEDDDSPTAPPPRETARAEVLGFADDEATSRRLDVSVAVPDSGRGVDHAELWARPQGGTWQLQTVIDSLDPVRVTVPAEGPFGPWEFAAVAVPDSGEPVDVLDAAEATVIIPEPITITDRHGEVWEITHAVHRWGLSVPGWQHGIGRHTLRPIIEPALSCPGDVDYLHPDNLTVVLGVFEGDEARAYKLGDLPDVEVVDDVFAGAHIAVTY